MGNDLIAWIVATTLVVAVVGLGWRRNLGETTRNWLPRFERASEQATVTPAPSAGGQGRRPLSPRQRRWMIWAYLLMSLTFATVAVLSAHHRLSNAILAGLFGLNIAVLWLKRPSSYLDERSKSDRPRFPLKDSSSVL
jgi:hypothetical protein